MKTQLDCNGWRANWARDAKTAIAKVRRESFDLAVLISTGPEMDVTETLFNLRDLRQSLPIAVVQTRAILRIHRQARPTWRRIVI